MRAISKLNALLLSALILSAPALPPEHSHPANQDHAGVVHRHWSVHSARHSAHPTIDEDDGRILWIDAGFVSQDRTDSAPPHLFVVGRTTVLAPELTGGLRVVKRDSFRVHGPPLDRSKPRAPPALLVL